MNIDVCIACDDNYAKYCATVMASIIENKAETDMPVFHILHGGLSADNLENLSRLGSVNFYKVDDKIFSQFLRKSKIGWTTPTLYRLKLASILDLDKVIYLDCDVIVTSSLKGYFEQDIDGYSLGVVPDVNYEAYMEGANIPKDQGYIYFNAGSLLMNLKKFRQDGIEEKLFDCLAEKWQDFVFSDQDALNSVLHKNVKKLEKRYNYLPTFVDLENSKNINAHRDITVIHYAGQKPWELAFRSSIRDVFWQYYKNCGCITEKQFRTEYNRYKMWNFTVTQFLYLLKLYPFGLFRASKRGLFKTVLRIRYK